MLDLYFEKIDKFRVDYIKLKKILQLIDQKFSNSQKNFVQNLSLKLNSLKR